MVKLSNIALLLVFLFSLIAADKLPVKLTPQEKDQWCWAATSECAIEYYGQEITQTEIVTEVKGSPVNQPGQPAEMEQALNMGNLDAKADQNISGWTEDRVQQYCQDGYVATTGYNRQHVISLVGVTVNGGSAIYHMMDPWPVNQGEWKDYTWAQFKNNEIGPLDLIVTTTGGVPPINGGTIEITSPSAGDEWMQGSEQTITWTDDIDGEVKIELVKGSSKTTISSSTASSGSFSWTVPEDQAAGSGYTVVITSVDKASVTDESGSFTIEEMDLTEYTLTVNDGDGGGSYVKGTAVEITADPAPADSLMFDAWTGSGASYCADKNSAQTVLTMPEKDCEVTPTYKEKPPTSDNLVLVNKWEKQVDADSDFSKDDSKVESDTIVTFEFTLATPEHDSDYVWTQVYHYLDTAKEAFKSVTAVEVTYKSDDDISLILSQEGLSDGGANYTHTLPKSSDWKTSIITINMDNFSQPGWVSGELKQDLDISKCSGVGFSPKIDEGKSSSAKFKTVCLFGYVAPVSVLSSMGNVQKTMAVQTVTTKTMQLWVPETGNYTLTLFAVDGRQLYSKKMQLEAGAQKVRWRGKALAQQVVLSRFENADGAAVLKRFILQ